MPQSEECYEINRAHKKVCTLEVFQKTRSTKINSGARKTSPNGISRHMQIRAYDQFLGNCLSYFYDKRFKQCIRLGTYDQFCEIAFPYFYDNRFKQYIRLLWTPNSLSLLLKESISRFLDFQHLHTYTNLFLIYYSGTKQCMNEILDYN